MSIQEQTYVQGGADFRFSGKKTKAALKAAIKDDPGEVYLFDTSAFGSKFSGSAKMLPPNISFNVVGPDPYSNRSWYATVYKGRDGVVRVK